MGRPQKRRFQGGHKSGDFEAATKIEAQTQPYIYLSIYLGFGLNRVQKKPLKAPIVATKEAPSKSGAFEGASFEAATNEAPSKA